MRDTLGTAESGAWRGGVVTGVDATLLPANASPRGWNSALALSRTGTPFVQKRRGLSCRGATQVTGAGAFLGQHDYVEVSTGTRRHLCTTATQIVVEAVDGTFTVLSSALTSDTPPDFVTANGLAFIFNGTDAYKVRGTTVENVGITRPTVGTMAGAVGAAGLHNGTYELRVAFKNTNTGHISSASDTAAATVVATNDAIDWSNVPVSADAQVGSRLLLVRNTATMAKFYVAGEIADNVTTTATTSVADENLTTLAPSTTNRNAPVSGQKYCTLYRGRLVVSDGEAIYWSKIDEPEAFDPFASDLIDSSGDVITGLAVNEGTLLVFKDDRTFAITGDLGGFYDLTQVSATMGCIAHRTIVMLNGSTYWWSRHGLTRFRGGAVECIGLTLYGDPNDTVSIGNISAACAVAHEERSTIYIALPGIGQTRATFLLAFNTVLDVFESNYWDPMDVASLGKAIDGNGILQPTLGSYAGQVFQLWSGNNDGIAANTSTGGSFTVAVGASVNSITFTDPNSLSADTTGGGLIERKITILNSDGEVVTTNPRPRITANTTTAVTFTPPITLDAGTYTLVIGGPNFQFDTPWRDFGDPWVKKRFEYLFLLIKGEEYGASATIVMSFDHDNLNLTSKDRTFTSTGVGAAWDSAVWDTDVWDSLQTQQRRYRPARVGRSWRARIINARANQPFAILLVGVQAAGQTVKN